MGFDVQGARKEGYSDAEIADYLASQKKFDVGGARNEGYSDAEIIKHLAGSGPSLARQAWDAAKEVPGAVSDFAGRASDYRDTQFAKAMGGVAGIPRAVSDAAGWAADKIDPSVRSAVSGLPIIGPALGLASQGPTAQEASNWMMDRNKARPDFTERNTTPIVDAAVQSAFSGPLMGMGGKMGPIINAAGAAGSEATGELAHNYMPDWETPARILGAVVGGSAPIAARAAVQPVKAAIAPFTDAGKEAIAGKALRSAAADPERAIQNIDSYQAGKAAFPDAVPGFSINAGQASRDPGLMAAAEVAAAKNPGMRAQVDANNTIVEDAMKRIGANLPDAGLSGPTIQRELGATVEGLKGVRAMETNPLYDAARNSPTPVKPFPLLAYTADTIAANKGEPANVMEKARSLLFTTDKNGRVIADRSAKGMMATREALNDMLSNQELGNHSRSLLQEMKQKVDDVLNAVPQAKAANARYAELSKPLDPFNPDLGDLNKTMGKIVERDQFGKDYVTPAEKVPSMLMKGGDLSAPMVAKLMDASGGNPAIRDAMRSAYLADFKKAAASKVMEDATGNARYTANGAATWMEKHGAGAKNVLTPEQYAALEDIRRNLSDQAQTIPGRTGSPTFDRLATDSIIGAATNPAYAKVPFLNSIRKALGVATSGADEAIASRVYEALADPAVAKALMMKATPGNAKMAEPVLNKLLLSAANQSSGRDAR